MFPYNIVGPNSCKSKIGMSKHLLSESENEHMHEEKENGYSSPIRGCRRSKGSLLESSNPVGDVQPTK
jgi:hypothetical protein